MMAAACLAEIEKTILRMEVEIRELLMLKRSGV